MYVEFGIEFLILSVSMALYFSRRVSSFSLMPSFRNSVTTGNTGSWKNYFFILSTKVTLIVFIDYVNLFHLVLFLKNDIVFNRHFSLLKNVASLKICRKGKKILQNGRLQAQTPWLLHSNQWLINEEYNFPFQTLLFKYNFWI